MIKLQLNTWERMQLLRCIPRDAPLTEIPQLLRLIDILTLTDAEKEAVEFLVEEFSTPQGPTTRETWKSNEREFELGFETADFEKLMQLIEQRKSWLIIEATLSLHEKLKKAKDKG